MHRDSTAICPSELVVDLASCIENNQTPRQWSMLLDQDLKIISSWLHAQSKGGTLLNPELCLTLCPRISPIWPSFEHGFTQ